MVNGRTNISMKTIFFDYLNAHEHSGAIIAHLPSGSIIFEMGTHIRGWF